MTYMTREKKEGHEFEALRIRPLLGRGKRIIQIPPNKPHQVFVGVAWIEIENEVKLFEVSIQPGLFDEGIIIVGEGKHDLYSYQK